MKKLIIAAGCLLIPYLGANQKVSTEAGAVLTAPSASQGLVLALGILKDEAPAGQFDVLRIQSEVVQATTSKPAAVAVSMDLRMHADGGAAAEKAFQTLGSGVANHLKALAPKEFDYQQVVAALIDPTMRAPEPKLGASSGAHQGTLQIVLPANLVAKALPAPDSNDPMQASRAMQYIRTVASQKQILFGALNIKPLASKSGKTTFHIEPNKGSESTTRLRTQLANFLYKLEEGTKHLVITKVSFDLNPHSRADKIQVQAASY